MAKRMAQRVLIVEDEQHLAEGLRFNLEAEGFEAAVLDNGDRALARLLDPAEHFDQVEVLRRIEQARQQKRFVPVLMLTARGRPEDVLNGFAAGADDYLAKPAELPILLARIGGLLRRSTWSHQRSAEAAAGPQRDSFSFGGKTIDFDTLELTVGDRVLQLTLMEANLLRYLTDHEGKAISRKAMLEQVWGLHEDTDTRAIDNFIVRLRRYIEKEPGKPRHLLTVRGVGYRFIASPEK